MSRQHRRRSALATVLAVVLPLVVAGGAGAALAVDYQRCQDALNSRELAERAEVISGLFVALESVQPDLATNDTDAERETRARFGATLVGLHDGWDEVNAAATQRREVGCGLW